MLWAFLNLNFKFRVILYCSALKHKPTINEKNQVHIGYEMEEDDYCNYCNIQVTNLNVVIFNFCWFDADNSNETDETIIYCKPCSAILRRDMNLRTGESQGIIMCYMCSMPKEECKCNARKIDYNIRKKLK